MRQHTLADRSTSNDLPYELRTWHEAVTGAYQMYAALDAADAERNRHLARPYSVSEKNELRELAAEAWTLYQRINAAGTRLLNLWDEDNQTWRRSPDRQEETVQPA